MKLVLRLVETGIDGSSRSVDVLEIVSRSDPGEGTLLPAGVGWTLPASSADMAELSKLDC